MRRLFWLFLFCFADLAAAERVTWAFISDGNRQRWQILVNSVGHAERALPADAQIWVVCADARCARACERLAGGARNVVCEKVREADAWEHGDRLAAKEGQLRDGKWNYFANRIKPNMLRGLVSRLSRAEPPSRLCFMDADVVLRSDPTEFVRRWPLVVTADDSGVNSGFVCLDPSHARAAALVQQYASACEASNYTFWEQPVLEDLLVKLGRTPDAHILRLAKWADGFDQFCRADSDARPKPDDPAYDERGSRFALHAACTVDKIASLKSAGLWDEPLVRRYPAVTEGLLPGPS